MSGANGNGPTRLSPTEHGQVLEAAGMPLATVVDADGRVIDDAVQLPITEPQPAKPAGVKLPVSRSAALGEIRSDGEAVAASVSYDYVVERVGLECSQAEALAQLGSLRDGLRTADERLEDLEERREQFVASLPRWVRRRLGQRSSRAARLTPWMLWGADTLMIANAYGLFGSVALPFPSSSYVSNGVELFRAAAVSFGLVFGLRLVGGRLRDLVTELREWKQSYGAAGEGLVIAAVVAGAVLLGLSAAKLQAAFLSLMLGSSAIHVPLSVLSSIIVFLGATSFASGFFSAEPELATFARLEGEIASARSVVEKLREALWLQLGKVRGLRKQLRGVADRERLDLAEQGAHTKRRAYRHVRGNVTVYSLEVGGDEAKVPGAS